MKERRRGGKGRGRRERERDLGWKGRTSQLEKSKIEKE
jgi:hypothetical protein